MKACGALGGGASLSLSPSCPSFSSQSPPSYAPSQSRTPPHSQPPSPPTPPLDLFLPFLSPPLTPFFSVLHWKGERMLSPHKSRSLLVLQEQDSCHREAPASPAQKGRAKSYNRRGKKRERGEQGWTEEEGSAWKDMWYSQRNWELRHGEVHFGSFRTDHRLNAKNKRTTCSKLNFI